MTIKQSRKCKTVFTSHKKRFLALKVKFRIAQLCFFGFSSNSKSGGFGGMFGMLKGLVGSKSLSREDMESVLEKMKDHLIGRTPPPPSLSLYQGFFPPLILLIYDPVAKNVAADIAYQLCDSVAKKLEGKVMGTFTSKYSFARPKSSPTFLNLSFNAACVTSL